jgi:hypothetical protein
MTHILRAAAFIVGPVVLVVAFPWIFRAVVATGSPAMALDRPQLFIPHSFGQYGYYRGDNVGEWVRLPVQFSPGPTECATCHSEKAQLRGSGAHSGLSCETCHGPADTHLQVGPTVKPAVPQASELCGLCHQPVVGRPEWFPQVDPAVHAGGNECTLCHNPHSPGVGR